MSERILRFTLLLVLSLATFSWVPSIQAMSTWSEPLIVNDQDPATPFILADTSGVVHVFWGGRGLNGERGAIFYRRLTDGVWSETVDILAPPVGDSALYPSAVIDAQGTIHLVWVSDKLYYSQAHISQALHPRGWSTPYQMTNYGSTNGVIQLNSDGSLNVLFGSQGANPAVYLLKSEDGGDFWQIAIQVSLPEYNAHTLNCDLAVDSSGHLHAVWTEALQSTAMEEGDQRIPSSGIYYAHSDDGGYRWSFPRKIAGEGQDDPAIGIDALDRVHLFWSGSGSVAGKYHTYLDTHSGEWQDTERVLPDGEGLLGKPALATDSSGRLNIAIPLASHSLFAKASQGEIVSLSWWDGQWGGEYQVTHNLMDVDVEHSHPALAISGGNQLHLIWIATDLGSTLNTASPTNLWYVTRSLDSPAIEPVQYPSLDIPLITSTPEVKATVIASTPTPWEVADSGLLPQQPIFYKQVPVVFGVLLALMILVGFTIPLFRKRS